MAVGAMQLVGAIYLMLVIVRDISNERRATSCFFGMFESDDQILSYICSAFQL
jgi:hypothetical protein